MGTSTPGSGKWDVLARAGRRADDPQMALMATETVSVLMTDLVGSTAMADRIGPAAAEELAPAAFRAVAGGA